MKPILKKIAASYIVLEIFALCVICAATLMSGCLETDDPVSTPQQPSVGDVFDEMEDNFAEADRIKVCAQEILMVSPTIPPKSSIPDDYYNISADQYFIDHKLYNYLEGYTWARPVGTGSWSFREAAELEHDLTNMGCNVKIRWAGLPEMDQVSCWLMIELDDEWVAYSPAYCYWIFQPVYGKNEYVSGGKWHDNWYHVEGTTSTWKGCTWTSRNFIDFDNIYELEEYYMSGDMQARYDADDMDGVWWTYFESDEYNATDDFVISFGWWMSEDELHETEKRINEATDWFVLVD